MLMRGRWCWAWVLGVGVGRGRGHGRGRGRGRGLVKQRPKRGWRFLFFFVNFDVVSVRKVNFLTVFGSING